MNPRILLVFLLSPLWSLTQAQTVLYSEDFSDNIGIVPSQTVYETGASGRSSWATSGPHNSNNSSGQLGFTGELENTCSWVSQSIDVAGYAALQLNVTLTELGTPSATDEVYVYVYEDGVSRLVASELGTDFGSLSLVNEPCTAAVSVQVLIYVRSESIMTGVYLDAVSVTGTASYTDVDMDGVDDAVDTCIDMDGDGVCDPVDAEIMLMEEDFSSYAVGTGLASCTDTPASNEAGEAYVQGFSAAGGAGWTLLGEAQKGSISVRASGGEQFIQFNYSGLNGADTTTVSWMSRSFDLGHILSPKVRVVLSEVTNFDGPPLYLDGGFVVYFIEDGVEREVLHVLGEFTSHDEVIASTAKESLIVVVKGYAQQFAQLRFDQVSVYGEYCQTGKDGNGDCQDIGCTDPRACSYSAIAITQDVSKCKYIGDACDDGVSSNFSDRYENAGDGTCSCQGYALQQIYLENFADNGAAQGGLGYGYEGSIDEDGDDIQNENNAALETEWSLEFEDSSYGTGEGLLSGPFSFFTEVVSSDTVMKAYNTAGSYIRWTSRGVSVSPFDSVYVTGELSGLGNQAAGDYARFGWEDDNTLQSPLLAEITGVSSATIAVDEKVNATSGTLRLQVEVENNTSGSNPIAAHSFDDMGVYGLKRGCSDPDASNYIASPADGHVALSDDGSCEYDWSKVYSRKDGGFDGTIWAGKPCSEAGYTCNTSSMYIDIHPVTETGTRHAVISANTLISVPAGGYSLGELTLESGAELSIPAGEILTVNGDFHHQGGTLSGTGRLVVKGEMELAAGVTSVDVHDFTFGAGGQLNLSGGAKLNVKGDLTIDDGSNISGRIELTGTSAQTVAGSDIRFDTLRVASAGVTFAANARVDGVLDIDQGVVEMDGNVLTFASDAGGTGMLDMIATGASLEDNSTGSLQAANAVVQRYIAPDGDGVTLNGYTSFASPLTGAVAGDLDGISGYFLAGFPGTQWPGSFATLLFWDETEDAFVEPANLNTPLDTLGGGWIFLAGFQNPVMETEGTLKSHVQGSTQTFALTRTAASNYAGWNMVFNPFQAALDWSAVYAASSGIQDQYAVFDTQTQNFKRRSSDGTFTSGATHIAPGQAFWVNLEAGSSTGTLTIPSTAISVADGDVPAFTRNSQGENDAVLMLEIENEFGTNKAYLSFGPGGDLSPVSGHDLSLMSSSSVKAGEMAVWSDDERYIKKLLPNEANVPLYVKSRANMETTMRVTGFTEGAEVCVVITDTETGEMIVSRVGDEMTFTLPEHEAAEGRFVLEVVRSATVFARPPSCPAMEDGRVEVSLGEEPTNVLLTDGGDNVLEQLIGYTGVAAFEGLSPGEYGLVVAGPGMRCGTEHRTFTVMPGEQPELLGLDWEVPACNAGEVTLDFELYGSGDFNASLRLGNEAVWANMETGGEVALEGLAPGTYALEVDHLCMEETIVLDLFDPAAVEAEADYDAMLVMDPVGGTALEALSTCLGEEHYRWVIDGEIVGQDEPLFHPIDAAGGHVVELEAWNNTCSDIVELPFLVLNWNEARVLEAPVSISEDASHWTVVFGQDLGATQLRMLDAAGREVWSGQVQAEEGYTYRVARPDVAGTYLMQVIGSNGQWGVPLLNAGF